MDFIYRIWDNRKRLFLFNAAVLILAVIVVMLLPKWYRSSVLILIQTDKKEFNLNTAISKMIPFGAGLDQNLEIQKHLSFLKSRFIADRVIDRFDLMNVYRVKYREDAYKELLANTAFIDNNNGTITIRCVYKGDPVKAAEMANAYYEELETLSLDISRKQAGQFGKMLEMNYQMRRDSLERLQRQFADFQVRTGIFEISEQIKLTLNSLSELELEKIQNELQLEYLNSVIAQETAEKKNLREQIQSYQNKINRIKNEAEYTNIAINRLPAQSIDYYRYFLNIEIENKVIEFIIIQLEQARIDENKIVSDLYQLDRAVPAERKYKPKRGAYVLLTGFFSFCLSLLFVQYQGKAWIFYRDLKRHHQ